MATKLESQLDNPTVTKLLPEQARTRIESELAAFGENRIRYVRETLTAGAAGAKELDSNSLITERIAGFRRFITTAFDDTMSALVRDLVIFNATNVAAFLIAWCLVRLDRPRWAVSLKVLSIFLFLATLFSTWMYIDQNWFFNILFKSHMGWSYPSLITLFFIWISIENATDTIRSKEDRQIVDGASCSPLGGG